VSAPLDTLSADWDLLPIVINPSQEGDMCRGNAFQGIRKRDAFLSSGMTQPTIYLCQEPSCGIAVAVRVA
jgi:hypothetical protein